MTVLGSRTAVGTSGICASRADTAGRWKGLWLGAGNCQLAAEVVQALVE